jgi:hypothetical protein
VQRIVYLKCNKKVFNDSSWDMEVVHPRSHTSLSIFLYWIVFSVMLTHISIGIVHIYECVLFVLGLFNADLVLVLFIRGNQRSTE